MVETFPFVAQVTVDGCSGPVNTFIVEPFVPHDAEYYLCVQSKRLGDDISFSDAGGVEIEANWDRVQTVRFQRHVILQCAPLAPKICVLRGI
jgi:ATP citrate (pro-S)-lyase